MKTIKPEDLEFRSDMTIAELYEQNRDLRTCLVESMTKMGAANIKAEALQKDNASLQERVGQLSKFESMDKVLVIEENTRLQNQHIADAHTIEHLTANVEELHKRINALEGCLSLAHEAIIKAQVIGESYGK